MAKGSTPTAPAAAAVQAQVLDVQQRGPVYCLRLHAPGYTFVAGQYTLVLPPDGAPGIPLSLASSPHLAPELELHYLPLPGNDDARRMDQLLAADQLQLAAAAGTVTVQPQDARPILYLAGGSGISQALAMASWTQQHQPERSQHLVWGLRDPAQLYCQPQLDAMAARGRINIQLVVETAGDGTLADALMRQGNDLSGHRVVLCGGPVMVHATMDALAHLGLSDANAEADVFSYAPRAPGGGNSIS